MIKSVTLLGLIFGFSLVGTAQAEWEIQPDYEIRFSGTKAEGTFRGLEGSIVFDAENLSASVFDVQLDVSTISTGNSTKDKHARGSSWFDADTFPRISFRSTSVLRDGMEFQARGLMSLKGVEKEVSLPFQFSEQEGEGVFVGSLRINREEYGIMGNFFGFVVGEEFEVSIRVPVKRKN